MSYWDYKKKLEVLPPRDRQIWDLHQKAQNSLGFATQMAAQGADGSQCKYERAAEEANSALWGLLTSGVAPENGTSTADKSSAEAKT